MPHITASCGDARGATACIWGPPCDRVQAQPLAERARRDASRALRGRLNDEQPYIYMHIAVEHARKSCPQAERADGREQSAPTDASRARQRTQAERAAAPNGEQSLPRDASRGRHSDTWQIRRTMQAMSETSSTNQIRVACAILGIQLIHPSCL